MSVPRPQMSMDRPMATQKGVIDIYKMILLILTPQVRWSVAKFRIFNQHSQSGATDWVWVHLDLTHLHFVILILLYNHMEGGYLHGSTFGALQTT